MTATIPSDTHLSGDTGHTADHNNIADCLAALNGATGTVTAAKAFNAGSPMTTLGDLIYENSTPAAARLAGNTSAAPRFLSQTGTGSASAAPAWNGISGTRPEWFGTISGSTGDDVAIQAAINAVNAGTCPGPVVISQPCAISNQLVLKAGVNLAGTGQGNRQVGPPDTFTGGYIFPASNFPASTALIAIGTSGAPTTNPNGTRLDGVCLSGYNGSSYTSGCIGVLITDTSDVHMTNCFLANFDRTGATGTCVYVTSATAGNGYGFCAASCIFSASWQGVYTTGAGATDMRFTGNLWHSNTQGLTVGGSNLGGGGTQVTNDHFTYSGMPSAGWHFQNGSQAGDFAITNNYFDQGGSAVVVQLANGKGIFSGNHFLAASTSTAATLVKLSTSGSQELTFCNNDCNGNGSSITSLFQTSAHSGAPTGGIYVGNAVYGTASSLIAVLIDSASAAIAAANTSSLYVAGNCSFT
jgi:hypothetical protein